MEPRSSSAEQLPQHPQVEQWTPPVNSERPNLSPESREVPAPVVEQSTSQISGERLAQAASASATLPAPQVDDQAGSDAGAPVSDDVPLVAADEDVIEKEWVDKAKKIISETKDDPHAREQQIKKLQVEYLRKRYGREIGQAAD